MCLYYLTHTLFTLPSRRGSQKTSPLHTQTLGEGGEEHLRDLVQGLLMAAVPVFEKMLPPFRGAFLVEV